MDMNFEQKVRERAYEIWMSAGMGHGHAHEHWMIAERAVASETGEPVAAKPARAKKASTATKPAAVKATPVKKAATKATPAKSPKMMVAAKKANAQGSGATH